MTEASSRGALERVVEAARRRLFLRRALHELDARFAPLCPLLACGSGALILFGATLEARLLIAAGLALALGFALRSLLSARLAASLSATLDESFRGRGVIGSAIDFLERGPDSLDPFQRLVVRDAERSLNDLRLPVALPIGFRTRHASTLLSLALLGLLSTFSVPRAGADPLIVPESAKDQATRLAADASKSRELAFEEARTLTEASQKLERAIEEGRLSPEEGFQRLAALEREAEEREGERAWARAVLQGLGDALGTSPPLSRLAQSLKQGNLEDARRALDALADRLRDEKQPLSKGELAALRAGIERAQAQVEEAARGAAQSGPSGESGPGGSERPGPEGASASRQESRPPAESRRQLERLGDQRREKGGLGQELSDLDRQLAEAARALEEDRHRAGEQFAQAAETMGKLAQNSLSDDQKRELLEALRRMRERLREKSQSKSDRDALEEFRKKAQGSSPPSGEGSEGDQGEGEGSQQQRASLSVSIEVPESGPGSEGSEGGDAAPPSTEAEASSGSKPGKNHSPDPAGPASRPMPAEGGDRISVAQNQDEGTEEAQIVATAARSGFTGARYQKLFQEYESAREETLRRERVPSGYRARVLRYFDLIRPKSSSSPAEKAPQ